MDSSMSEIFSMFRDHLDSEQEVREEIRTVLKEIDLASRDMLTTLQGIHNEHGLQDVAAICQRARGNLPVIKEGYKKLSGLVTPETYYKFHDHWRYVTQRLTSLITLIVYLEEGKLATRERVAEHLGIKCVRQEGFHLDLEDYLSGVLLFTSELSRLAVNSVTYGNYSKPLELSRFITELNAGFRLLNLKNDSLRKRFDALKYDVKKIEEVVYDLSLRGLIARQGEAAANAE